MANFSLVAYVDRGLPPRHVELLKPPFQSETAQRDVLQIVGSIPQKLTTSHVIGELQGLSSKLPGHVRESFWSKSIVLLRQWNLDERLIRLLDLASGRTVGSSLGRIGPPDAGVIQLALQEQCALITEDEKTLYAEALTMGIDCHLLKNIIPLR